MSIVHGADEGPWSHVRMGSRAGPGGPLGGLCDLVKADIKTPFRLFISTEECDWASQISHLWALDLFWLWG